MTEIELLKLLNNKLRKARFAEIGYDISTDIKEKKQKQTELKVLETQIGKIKSDLQNVPNKEQSLNARGNMVDQLSTYINEIDDILDGFRLDRNQGFIINNYLFVMIMGDLKTFVTDNLSGISHHYLECTYDNENSIDKTDLRNFLAQEIQILRNIDNPDYVKLRNYMSDLETRIIEKYIE